MLGGDFKDVSLLLANNLMRFAHIIGDRIAWEEAEIDDIRRACINILEEESACGYIPRFLLLQMEMHAELSACVKVEDLPTVEFVIDENKLISPPLLHTCRGGDFSRPGWRNRHVLGMERLVVDEEVVGRLAHEQLVILAPPGGELDLCKKGVVDA